jgi:hypothetical protein
VTATCTDNAGKVATKQSATFQFEATNPTVGSVALPQPDVAASPTGSWYTTPVIAGVTPRSNSFSGIAACSSSTYNGPDSKTATVIGTCTDNAGKTSPAVTSTPFHYEASSPTVSTSVPSADHNGW